MLTWEQMDKLNEIATDESKSAEVRTSQIMATRDEWAAAVNSCIPYLPTNHLLWGDDVIDPGKESVKARIPVPGQIGRYAYPDVFMDQTS